MSENTKRKVMKYVDNHGIEIQFSKIKAGDIIRLFEPTGENVTDKEGNFIFVAAEDSYKNKYGTLTFDTKYEAKSLEEIKHKISMDEKAK